MSPEQRQQFLSTSQIQSVKGLPATLTTAGVQTGIQLSGFAAYQAAAVVANGLSSALLGHGLAFGANAALMKGISIFAGPVGWAFTAMLGARALGGPAFRVTIPCVVQVAFIRQQQQQLRRKSLVLGLVILISVLAVLVLFLIYAWIRGGH
jgi:uncharacterized protein YaaW (UPF0174 family)